MGILENLAKKAIRQVGSDLTKQAVNAAQNTTRSVTFSSLPGSLAELQALPQADLKDPYNVAALSVLALTVYETSKDECFRMLDFLKGPEDVTVREKQFIADRLNGKQYVVNSYFKGAVPGNDYKPSVPYTITVNSNPYSFQNEGWATLYLVSGGADSPRFIKLRQKPSTGQWFVNEIGYLGDIRLPVSKDAWA